LDVDIDFMDVYDERTRRGNSVVNSEKHSGRRPKWIDLQARAGIVNAVPVRARKVDQVRRYSQVAVIENEASTLVGCCAGHALELIFPAR
jgi:hypothetical protein